MSSYAFPYPCSEPSVHGHVEWHREQRNVVRLPMLKHWLLNYASRRRKMIYDLMNTGCAEDGEPSDIAEDIPAERLSPVSLLSNPQCCEMGLPELAAQCLRELDHYRRVSHAPIHMASSCYIVRLSKTTRRPGRGCNTASVGWYEGGCDVILRERWRVAWRAKRTM